MHFIEPMISQEVLLRKEDIPLEVPTPRVFDRDTLYAGAAAQLTAAF